MRKVLVTAIGTATATAIVKQLKGKYYVIGADINKKSEIATSLDVDEFHTFPPISDMRAYLKFVYHFCEENRIAYYYAVLDKEVVAISAMRDKFAKIGTKLCVPNGSFAQLCHYKDIFGDWVNRNMPEIAIKTYLSEDGVAADDFPLFVKPVEGVASAGCHPVHNFYELKKISWKHVIVQKMMTGTNITVDLVRNKKTGQMAQIQRRELLRNGNGCGIAVEIFEDPLLTAICEKLMQKLDLNGVANAEFFYEDGKYKIIEINPRFSAGTLYSCYAGVNTVQCAMAIANEEPCVISAVDVGARFAERYEVYKM